MGDNILHLTDRIDGEMGDNILHLTDRIDAS